MLNMIRVNGDNDFACSINLMGGKRTLGETMMEIRQENNDCCSFVDVEGTNEYDRRV